MKALKGWQQIALNTQSTSIIFSPPDLQSGKRAIEEEEFPFEQLSVIAELESWRKEVNRPIYYIHKWWARRLGSVFRSIIIAAFAPQGSDILDLFYKPFSLNRAKVFDPFMGSGTTVGEAIKLGATAIGRDINPVAYFLVKNALRTKQRQCVIEAFDTIREKVAEQIQYFYTTILDDGDPATVLYYFWVKFVPCPKCSQSVDLFSSYIFSKHAYPKKFPQSQAVCPDCGGVNSIHYADERAICTNCSVAFNPQIATVKGQKATCRSCGYTFAIAKTVRQLGKPPAHRMYAKMVLLRDGSKKYLPINKYDERLYSEAKENLEQRQNAYPVVAIEPGYNTDQVLNYCYRYWHEMFNERQLLCLNMLAEQIKRVDDLELRELFTCLFSGTLEFNNMFASFKGEGTGAVRHMFSHHILKPERTPIEANIWGTPKSSGAFSTLFDSRLIRALDYCEHPFEIKPVQKNGRLQAEKMYGLSPVIGTKIAEQFAELSDFVPVYLSCGDSATTDIPTESIDAVVTDPPFFDNVHYSQLADFFYVWQRYLASEKVVCNDTTRHLSEVQSSEPLVFALRLQRVLAECYRVLRPNGLMIFSYHHSRVDGWSSILTALVKTGFAIVATHPIKSEMSVATPKSQAKDPIDLDVIIVCRKRDLVELNDNITNILAQAIQNAENQVQRFNIVGRRLSRNDTLVIFMAQILKHLSVHYHLEMALSWLDAQDKLIQQSIEDIYTGQKE